MGTCALCLRLGVPLLLMLLWFLSLVGEETGAQSQATGRQALFPVTEVYDQRQVVLLESMSSLVVSTPERDQSLHQVTAVMDRVPRLGYINPTVTPVGGEHHDSLRQSTETAKDYPEETTGQVVGLSYQSSKKFIKRIQKSFINHKNSLVKIPKLIISGLQNSNMDSSNVKSNYHFGRTGRVARQALTSSSNALETSSQPDAQNNFLIRTNLNSANISEIIEKGALNGKDINFPPYSVDLCDHPPHVFSPGFHGYSNDKCKGINKWRILSFSTVEKLCFSLYKTTANSIPNGYSYQSAESGNKTFVIFVNSHYVRLCEPFYKKFNFCNENKYLTVCNNTGMIFINPNTCPVPLDTEDWFTELVVSNYFGGNMHCIEKICDGTYKMVRKEINGIRVYLLRCYFCECKKPFEPFLSSSVAIHLHISINTQWPCCYAMYTVIWGGNPKEYELYGGWSYLETSCQVGEVLLLVMVACVALSGVVGNFLVLLVMTLSGRLRNHTLGLESSMLRTSLTVADLTSALFVVCPSLYYHILPFYSTPRYSSHNVNDYLRALPIRDGLPLLQAMLCTVCSIASILTIFILSIERLILTNRALRYRHYFTIPIVKGIIIFIWIMALLDTLLLTYSEKNKQITAVWLTFLKLPLGIAGVPNSKWAFAFSMSHYILLHIVCLLTIAFSVAGIISFVREQAHIQEEWQVLNMKYSGPMKKENFYILTTQSLILFFFVISVIPYVVISIYSRFSSRYSDIPEIYRYLSRWCFVASAAWNPWIYNFRSGQFHEDAALTWRAVRRCFIHSSQSILKYL